MLEDYYKLNERDRESARHNFWVVRFALAVEKWEKEQEAKDEAKNSNV